MELCQCFRAGAVVYHSFFSHPESSLPLSHQMKLDASLLRFLDDDHWQVLTAVEQGMKNHELVCPPSENIHPEGPGHIC